MATETDDVLREVVGDDDPRTWESDEQWIENLAGKAEHDHVEVALYAGTIRRILSRLRGPRWWLDGTCCHIYRNEGGVQCICTLPKFHADSMNATPHSGPTLLHMDAGRDVVCHSEENDLNATQVFADVNCPHCLLQMKDACCLDCGLPYSDFPLDLLLPRSQWLEIHPEDGGLLCAACIVRRIAEKMKGATAVHAVVEIVPQR